MFQSKVTNAGILDTQKRIYKLHHSKYAIDLSLNNSLNILAENKRMFLFFTF